MPEAPRSELMAGYRVLDLSDEKGMLCGKMFADMGAEVIKIEPPGGDTARTLPPFYHDQVDPEKSLFWLAYNTGKKSVSLDLTTADGQAAFRELASVSDFVIETFPPGYLDALGLGYPALSQLNPRLILTSITPFGDTEPGRSQQADDLIAWATGGAMAIMGEKDRGPVRMNLLQSYFHASAEAAVGSMTAHYPREISGEGQHVVVNMQACVVWTLMNEQAFPILHGNSVERNGVFVGSEGMRQRLVFPCKDGKITLLVAGGPLTPSLTAFIGWMDENGLAPQWMLDKDWTQWGPATFMNAKGDAVQREIDAIETAITTFLKTLTKAEIYAQALKRRILLAPVSTVADIAASEQLAARNYFVPVEHEDLQETIPYPGPFVKMSQTPLAVAGRAPHIGEHTKEVYTELRPDSTAQRTPLTQRRYAFEGIKVLDFAWVGVGPITGKYLADHGATVIRIESRTRPDILRQAPPWTDGEPGLDRSQFFASFNTSKYGITLDLSQPKAQELAKKLIAWADVAIESFTPKAMRNWGLDYQQLCKINPELIMLSTCQQGQTGPHALYPGFGNLMASLTGFYHISGWPDRDPAPPYGAYTDFIAPRFGATALMAALDYRRRTGKGQYIDMAQSEAALHFLSPALLDYQVNGRVLNREGNRSFRSAPHGVYRCQGQEGQEGHGEQDHWLAISVSDNAQWQGLLKTLGNPAWGNEARFTTQSGRIQHAEALDESVGAWAAEQAAETAADTLQHAGVPAGVVQNCLDLHQDPRLAAWGMFHYLDHKEMGPSPYEGHQFHLSKTPGELRWPAPVMGQHNEHVFGDILGLSPEEIAQLMEEKVIY